MRRTINKTLKNTIATTIEALTLITLTTFSPACEKSPDANTIGTNDTATNQTTTTKTETESNSNKRTINTGAEIANDPLPTLVGTHVYEFDIIGMTCAGCASTIGSALQPLPGVQNVRISLIKNKAWIRVLENSPTTQNKIAVTIKEAGYEPTFIQAPADENKTEKQPPSQENSNAGDNG